MRFLERFAEAFRVDVRIDLRGRDVRVPEHFLDAHDFGTVLEQVRREAVSQHMRTRLALPADAAEQVVDVVPQRADGEGLAVFAQEYVARFVWRVPCLDFCSPELL